jgi:hypothetical protein
MNRADCAVLISLGATFGVIAAIAGQHDLGCTRTTSSRFPPQVTKAVPGGVWFAPPTTMRVHEQKQVPS